MVHISYNTWWIDSGTTIHVANTMQGFLNQRKPTESECSIYSGNRISSHVEAVGTYRLVLRSGFVLNLENSFFVPSFSRNLISVSRLLPYGFSFKFVGISFHLIKDNVVVGDGILDNGLFKLYLNPGFNHSLTTMHGNVDIKCGVINEKSSISWHKRLGHISIEGIKRMVNDGILEALDFTDFDSCVDYIKGKQTNMTKKQSVRRTFDILEIIHTDISGLYDMCLNSQRYFITFIDDYSRYMYFFFTL